MFLVVILSIGTIMQCNLKTMAAEEDYRLLVEEFINDNLSGVVEGENWNYSTTILDTITLYDLDDNISGYVCVLQQNGKEAGYVQVSIADEGFEVVAYSYSGTSAVESIYGEQADDLHIYELGVMDYAVEENGKEDNLVLSSGEIVDREEVSAEIELQKSVLKNQKLSSEVSAASTITSGSTMLSGYNKFTLAEMDNFSGYTNHCSPTAGTNIFKYYYYGRGINVYSSDSTTFQKLYSYMGTTAAGTDRPNIYTAMSAYAKSYSPIIRALEKETNPSLSYVTGLISDGYPALLSLDGFSGSQKGHSVVVFGYMTPYIIISTGWDTEFHYYQYPALSVVQSVCVGY